MKRDEIFKKKIKGVLILERSSLRVKDVDYIEKRKVIDLQEEIKVVEVLPTKKEKNDTEKP